MSQSRVGCFCLRVVYHKLDIIAVQAFSVSQKPFCMFAGHEPRAVSMLGMNDTKTASGPELKRPDVSV